jgi:hypothetical protein
MRDRGPGITQGSPMLTVLSDGLSLPFRLCALALRGPRLTSRLCLAALGEHPGDPIPGGLGLRGLIPLLRRLEDGWTVRMLRLSHLNRHAQGQEHFTELGTSSRFGQGAYDI